jgi:hypothetical protein
MSNGWIPTTERLPDQREFIEAYVRDAYAAEFLVTIEGADKATTLYYSQTGVCSMNRENRIRLWRGCCSRKGIKDNGRR